MIDIRKFLPIILLVVLALLGVGMCNLRNNAVLKDENVTNAWAQVENQYQRRADLIPNLVNTVKGYADFEQKTLQGVIEARANATRVTIKADELTPENIQKFEQAQGAVSGALGRLLAVAENYPNLKANENFLSLQTQLEGTENRITLERKNFNEAVKVYNSYIRVFPNNMLGFSPKGYFQSNPGSDKAPEVQF